jgi:putative transposase
MDRPTRRFSLRYEAHDYSGDGWYFVTVCTADRRHLFARIEDDCMELTDAGRIVTDVWSRIPSVDDRVTIDLFVVMPDHFHGIIMVRGPARSRTSRTLSSTIGTFKSVASREIRRRFPDVGQVWQRGFHDRVIRSVNELYRVQDYILTNPSRWVDRATRRATPCVARIDHAPG